MSWTEFAELLENLPSDSQLAYVVYTRKAEGDDLQNLNPAQQRMRSDWYEWINSHETWEENHSGKDQLAATLKSLFYTKGG